MQNKNDIVKNIIELKFAKEGYNIVSNSDNIVNLVRKTIDNKKGNFIFEKSYLFSIFIAELKFNSQYIKLINCNATRDRLDKDLSELENLDISDILVIYYNVGKCEDINILSNILNKTVILCL